MDKEEKYEKLIQKFIGKKNLKIATIIREGKVGARLAAKIHQEVKNYHDEVYWHGCLYEMESLEKMPTPKRIQERFGISRFFAEKLLCRYMELKYED